MTNLEELTELNRQLTSLLSDPHPGLSTWRLAIGRVIRQVAAFDGSGESQEYFVGEAVATRRMSLVIDGGSIKIFGAGTFRIYQRVS